MYENASSLLGSMKYCGKVYCKLSGMSTGNLAAYSAELWGGQPLKVAKYGIFNASPQTAASPDATWMTAHQLPSSTETMNSSESQPKPAYLRDYIKSFDDTPGTSVGSNVHWQCLPSTQLLKKLAELSCDRQGAVRSGPLSEYKQKPHKLSKTVSAQLPAVCSRACLEKTKVADPAGRATGHIILLSHIESIQLKTP